MRLKGGYFFWPYFFLPFFLLIFFGRKAGYLPPAVTGSEWDISGCFRRLSEEASMKAEVILRTLCSCLCFLRPALLLQY